MSDRFRDLVEKRLSEGPGAGVWLRFSRAGVEVLEPGSIVSASQIMSDGWPDKNIKAEVTGLVMESYYDSESVADAGTISDLTFDALQQEVEFYSRYDVDTVAVDYLSCADAMHRLDATRAYTRASIRQGVDVSGIATLSLTDTNGEFIGTIELPFMGWFQPSQECIDVYELDLDNLGK